VASSRHTLGDWWFFARVVAHGPRGIWDIGTLAIICDHTSARLLQDLAGKVGEAGPEELLRAAHAAALWAADLDLLMADETAAPGVRKQHGSSVIVLSESLRAVEQATHRAAVAGEADTRAQQELRAALARFSIAFEPLLAAYVDVARRLHGNVLAVDPSRA
jgi:hypothetical protein